LFGQIAHVLLQRNGYGFVDLSLVYLVRDTEQDAQHDRRMSKAYAMV
jgi:hypothetical protein